MLSGRPVGAWLKLGRERKQWFTFTDGELIISIRHTQYESERISLGVRHCGAGKQIMVPWQTSFCWIFCVWLVKWLKDEFQYWGIYSFQLLWLLWFFLGSADTSAFKKIPFNIVQQTNVIWNSTEPPSYLAPNAIQLTHSTLKTPQLWLFNYLATCCLVADEKPKSIGRRNVSGLWS